MDKIGIFGGSFDPIHFGHINSMTTVREKMGLDRVLVVPTAESPLKVKTQGESPEARWAMIEAGLSHQSEEFQISDLEIKRGGTSYTVDTLRELQNSGSEDQFFLIIGLDQLQQFDQWKNFDEILNRVDLIVTSRPGLHFPKIARQFPREIAEWIEDFDGQVAMLKNGRSIYFVQLEDVEASSSEIRRKIRLGQPIHGMVPSEVASYIEEHQLYAALNKKIGDFEKFTHFSADILKDHGGILVRAFDLREINSPSEFGLVTSGTSVRHASSLAEKLIEETRKKYGVWPQGIEGLKEGRWVVVDYGSLLVHVFYDFVRQEYRLEDLWKEGKEIKL
ncbi:MAG: ribosome silencing factor RsfS [Bdellovibrionaceae bacterium]|nr:ribosome silencing factor RsfS [Pseudobdellovibrionaceae bacterium]|tara:strand:- start:1997 stop:2998 length:1002 start_codon:yes stop_codon:yes gene_type:complete